MVTKYYTLNLYFKNLSLCMANFCRKLSQYDEINNLHVHVTSPSTIYIDLIGKFTNKTRVNMNFSNMKFSMSLLSN